MRTLNFGRASSENATTIHHHPVHLAGVLTASLTKPVNEYRSKRDQAAGNLSFGALRRLQRLPSVLGSYTMQ